MKLRQRLILSLTLVTGVSLTGAFGAVSALFDYSQRKSFDDTLLRVAKTESEEASQFNFRFSERPGPAGSDVGPLNDFGVIYGENHAVLAATAPFDAAPPKLGELVHPLGKPFDLVFRNLNLRAVLVPIPSSPGKMVLIASSRENLEVTSRFLHRAMFVSFFVSVAWSTVLAIWLVRRQTVHHENIAAVARRVANGDFAARVTTHVSDIEEAQLGRDIDQMIDQLSALVTSQLRFTANAAHELRSPIAAVYGELQQTLRKPRDNEGYRAGIERAMRGARRLKQLTDDLLTLVRPTGDAAAVRADIAQLIESAVAPLEHFANERSVKLSFERGESEQVVGHTRDLERMLRNLVENALRHARQGGVVQVRSQRYGQAIEIHVTDDGPGVADDDRERIFEPFYRAPNARALAPDGSGLGLAIAREIARAHDGDITLAESRPEPSGARFVVRLPSVVTTEHAPH